MLSCISKVQGNGKQGCRGKKANDAIKMLGGSWENDFSICCKHNIRPSFTMFHW